MDSSFSSKTGSDYDWEFLFGTYCYEGTTGLYQVRNRDYHPHLGCWLERDPEGYVDGLNLYQAYFVPGGLDPYGLEEFKWDDPCTKDKSGMTMDIDGYDYNLTKNEFSELLKLESLKMKE